ncbi:hypothetical protein HK097_001182 [Rhizophlyctis rosea]|uniref:GH16 domain-containing protein n=1 Tax=Rhizophlyctis rosea TaxID=64517 RepID=A0AAD5S6X7_9FUNG|nr:hypothetical protein HK097_001182 [Rhizophlyctis rosea]
MRTIAYTLLALAAPILPALGQANVTGNCVTGRLNFDALRIFRSDPSVAVPPAAPIPSGGTVANYDFSLNLGTIEFESNNTGRIFVKREATGPAIGTKVSSSRYVLYGSITARLRAVPQAGVVTTFITMSDRHDEIDWEITGGDTRTAQSNVFYKGIQEFGVHGAVHNIPNGGSVADFHDYTIEWRSDRIRWLIDGVEQRSLARESSTSPMTPPGERWFPSTPSLFQISVWDGGSSDSEGTRSWAGGPIQWGAAQNLSALYQYVDVQCYDDQNRPVPAWPATTPARGATLNNTTPLTAPNATSGGHTVLAQPTALPPPPPGNKNAASTSGAVEVVSTVMSGSKAALAALFVAVLAVGL